MRNCSVGFLLSFALLIASISVAADARSGESETVNGRSKSRPSPCMSGMLWQLSMDFEGGSEITDDVRGQVAELGEGSVKKCSDSGRRRGAGIGRLAAPQIQYQGGRSEDRGARVIEDPMEPGNHVMQYWLKSPNVPNARGFGVKGRVQMNLYGNQGIRQVRQTVRLLLPTDVRKIRDYPRAIPWLTVSEWWNNSDWTGTPYPFRISVNLVKSSAQPGAPLHFAVHAQTFNRQTQRWDQTVWSAVNMDFSVPEARWMNLDFRFVEGSASTGRFYLAVSRSGESPKTLFDIKDWTHHPNDPKPDGLSHFNPIKLYTSKELIDHVRARGGLVQVFWDDLNITACGAILAGVDVAQPDWQPCATAR